MIHPILQRCIPINSYNIQLSQNITHQKNKYYILPNKHLSN